ncbi:MAG: hypothetical protein HYX59_11160 [Elusimicrobia bacterium]|nr:hypothetical protein [Elusimicrobiota bacterium]
MKYWVYKESRILGPFDKEAVSGLPGLDAGTLVCAGDPSGGSWTPAGELSELSVLPDGGAGPLDDFPSTSGLLDQLQIDSAGLIGDDEFPASLAEDLFQDASFKKDFKDILSPSANAEEAEARRAREKIAELTAQLEAMYRHVSSLEAAQTDLSRRLAAKDLELRSRGVPPASAPPAAQSSAAPAAPEGVKTFLSPAPPPIPGGPPPVAAVPTSPAAEPPSEWPQTPVGGGFPSFAGGAFTPPAPPPPAEKLPAASAAAPDAVDLPKADLPAIPSFAAAAAPELPSIPPPAAPLEAPSPLAPAPGKLHFGKAHSFKIVPTKKSFKVLGAEDTAHGASANPVPEFKLEPIVEAAPVQTPPPAAMPPVPTPAPMPVIPPPPISLAPIVPPPAPVVMTPPTPAPIPVMAPMTTPEPSAVINPFTVPSQPAPAIPTPAATPVAPPPNTLSRSQPVPDLTGGDMTGSSDATSQVPPPATMARSGGASAPAAADDAVAARFAKPEPAPPTGEIKKPGRNNKAFLIAGGVLVTLLVVLGVVFMRQPKDDLRQMTTLDDGKAPIGVTADEGAVAPPPIVKPKIAEAPAPAPAPAPGPSAEHLAAIEAVKDFPLDGDRGTVGRWLQYSYTASPGAGTEEWNASTTGENTVLVEYRLVPGSSVGKGALYLFEVDGNGIVMGKNIEARQMLAGGPPPEAPKAKKKPAKKAAYKRRVENETPKEVPLLPLPDSGELRPPAEDDGSFGSDTINSGI